MRFSGIGVLAVGLGVLWVSAVQAQQVGFTQADRERMVRMETTLQIFMETTNRCFTEQRKDINQRFEQGDADSANDRRCLHRVLPCDARLCLVRPSHSRPQGQG